MLTPAPLRFGRRLNRGWDTKNLLSSGDSSPESSDGPSALGCCWPRAWEMIVHGMSRGKLCRAKSKTKAADETAVKTVVVVVHTTTASVSRACWVSHGVILIMSDRGHNCFTQSMVITDTQLWTCVSKCQSCHSSENLKTQGPLSKHSHFCKWTDLSIFAQIKAPAPARSPW